jgi:NAD(P)-dependent dehydrogenase (short-subunit alcohol dehydrogenase family)
MAGQRVVNNAGVAGTLGLTDGGFDLTYATNHLGPFLLTNLLLPRLRESSAARIVNVSSMAHLRPREIDWTVLDRRSVPKGSGFHDYAITTIGAGRRARTRWRPGGQAFTASASGACAMNVVSCAAKMVAMARTDSICSWL